MRRFSAAVAIFAIVVLASTSASARPRHHHHHYRHHQHHHAVSVASAEPALLSGFGSISADIGAGRPAGAPSRWCGFWLRLRKGIHDAAYNAVKTWHGYGSHVAACTPGAVAIIRPSHVGEVVSCKDGGAVVLSGNHGHRVGVGFYAAGKISEYRT